jgi:glycosyltransferase involved in cell wall biosynthesis
MKIAHVTLYPPKGEKHVKGSGVASYSKNLISNIPVSQQTVISNILTKPEEYNEDDLRIVRAFWRKPSFIIAIHRALKRSAPDIIHIQQELALFGGFSTAYLLQWLVFMWRKNTIVTIHGIVDPSAITKQFVAENNSRLPAWLVRLAFRIIYTPLMRHARHIIVHEQQFKNIVVHKYGIAAQKITVIPHGVEALQTSNKLLARRALKLPADADIALFMGYATGYKGLDLLIDGFAQYASQNKNAYLVIGAGKHPKLHSDPTYLAEYQRLQDKAAQNIPRSQYEWRGFIEEGEIENYYSASDVSLYPYTTAMSSSGPMSFAIGFERPFLVSDAFADIFAAHPHLLFDRTPKAFAERLAYFFAHPNEYAELSNQLKQHRTWQSVGRQSHDVYQKVYQENTL